MCYINRTTSEARYIESAGLAAFRVIPGGPKVRPGIQTARAGAFGRWIPYPPRRGRRESGGEPGAQTSPPPSFGRTPFRRHSRRTAGSYVIRRKSGPRSRDYAVRFGERVLEWKRTPAMVGRNVVLAVNCLTGNLSPLTEERIMADRKPILGDSPPRPELDNHFENARRNGVSEAELREQRISFAYGNAPQNSGITKESVREASQSMRMQV